MKRQSLRSFAVWMLNVARDARRGKPHPDPFITAAALVYEDAMLDVSEEFLRWAREKPTEIEKFNTALERN